MPDLSRFERSPMAEGRGLVSMSYGGDSEISDSEERTSAGHTPPGLVVGVPVSAARVPPSSPPSRFERPQVHAATSIAGGGGVSGLVAYGLEEGEEGREVEDEVFPAAAATYRHGVNTAMYIMQLLYKLYYYNNYHSGNFHIFIFVVVMVQCES